MHKLSHLVNGEWTEHTYEPVHEWSNTGGHERLNVGVHGDSAPLFERLVMQMQALYDLDETHLARIFDAVPRRLRIRTALEGDSQALPPPERIMPPANEDPSARPRPAPASTAATAPPSAQPETVEPDWISTRIAAAQAGNSIVSDTIAKRLDGLLRGALAADALSKPEVTRLAKELLASAATQDAESRGAP